MLQLSEAICFCHHLLSRLNYRVENADVWADVSGRCLTWKTLSRTSLPAAAGSRPVTWPRPLAADHLRPQSKVLVPVTSVFVLAMLALPMMSQTRFPH